MKKNLLTIILVLACVNVVFTQAKNSIDLTIENIPDSTLFNNYLDSIEKYVYQDSRKMIKYKLLCEEMISSGKELSNANRFEFVIQSIYYQYTQDNTLEAFRIIETNKKMLDLDGISHSQKQGFKYLDGYTSMILGNIDIAQATFYQLMAKALEKKDTSSLFQALNSLGETYERQQDYDNAEKYYLDSYHLIKKMENRENSKIHVFLILTNLYLNKDDLSNAEYYNSFALNLADSLKVLDFKFDLLLQKVDLLIKKKQVLSAEKTYQEAFSLAKEMNNSHYFNVCNKTYAKILVAEKRHEEALRIYDELIEKEEVGQRVLPKLLDFYQSAHTIANKNNNIEKAYQYLLKANKVQDSLNLTEQLQKTSFLKIKFDVEQKEKENEILMAQISRKKFQNNFLYALAFIFLMFIMILFGSIAQKRRYNKRLKEEIKNRTKALEKANTLLSKSNEELNQFNNILSHDLKEPLRSIVGFSSLAKKQSGENRLLNEYLDFINKSGKQLNQLIDDVANFQKIGSDYFDEYKKIDTNHIVRTIINGIEPSLEERNAKVVFSNLPIIYSNQSLVFLVFKSLIENGIKYNESLVPTIQIKYEKKPDMHCFLFHDNGIGIDPEFHEKIFGMFKRLNDRKAYNGSGLGLNIAKKLMDKVEGDISIVTSNEGIGSIFEINFPIIKDNDIYSYKLDIPNSN